ncbi:MAG: PEP-CTERM sorting domain-containing protein [Verrucomicrobia bacterium]|nr:PEP-CTERM sorting domain-containing protein [Verrucomicrobiota bacterium]
MGAVDAPIYDLGGMTKAEGPDIVAQLYWGTEADSLAPVGAAEPLKSGAGTGYFLGGSRTLPVPGGTSVYVQVKAWETKGGTYTSYESAMSGFAKYGESNILQLTVTEAPDTPPDLVGLESFSLTVIPEPSTIALGLLGAAALLLRRRK